MGLAGLLFVASCLALIHEINAQRAGLEDYLSIGNVNGCDVYSSWHDKTESQHIFAAPKNVTPFIVLPGRCSDDAKSFSEWYFSTRV